METCLETLLVTTIPEKWQTLWWVLSNHSTEPHSGEKDICMGGEEDDCLSGFVYLQFN